MAHVLEVGRDYSNVATDNPGTVAQATDLVCSVGTPQAQNVTTLRVVVEVAQQGSDKMEPRTLDSDLNAFS